MSQNQRHKPLSFIESLLHDDMLISLYVCICICSMSIRLEVSTNITAASLIRIILQIYRKENSAHLDPIMLDTAGHYQLYICGEDGRVDTDFPGLDEHCILGTTASVFFALQHKHHSHHSSNHISSAPPLPRYPPKKRPSISSASVASHIYSQSFVEDEEHEPHIDNGHHLHHHHQPAAFSIESVGDERLMNDRPWWSRIFLCCSLGEESKAARDTHTDTQTVSVAAVDADHREASHRRSSSAGPAHSWSSHRLSVSVANLLHRLKSNSSAAQPVDEVADRRKNSE